MRFFLGATSACFFTRTRLHVHRNVHGCHVDRRSLAVNDDHGHGVQERCDRDRYGFRPVDVFAQQPPRPVLGRVMVVNFDDRRRLLLARAHGTTQRRVHYSDDGTL